MIAARTTFLAVGLTLIGMMTAENVPAQEKKKAAPAELMPSAILDKLELTAAQKEKADRLQQDFTEQVKAARKLSQADLQKAKADSDKAAMKKAAAELKIKTETIREGLEGKFVELLNDQQKKKYEELKKGTPAAGVVADTIKGKIKSINLEKGTLVLTADGKDSTFRLSRATKAVNKDGEELPKGLDDKGLAPGAEVVLSIEKQGKLLQSTNVKEIKLSDK
jgi:hypothetical protein